MLRERGGREMEKTEETNINKTKLSKMICNNLPTESIGKQRKIMDG
jgi:hypothetical protein